MTLKKLLKNPKVGDTFYKIMDGKQIRYQKCEITSIKLDKTYEIIYYYIKGESNKKLKSFQNANIAYYKTRIFKDKLSLLKYINEIIPVTYRKVTPQIISEIEKIKREKPQHFI
jgi:hypothetical protein